MTRLLLCIVFLNILVMKVQSCPDISILNKALNETLKTGVRLLNDNLPHTFWGKLPYKNCNRSANFIYETNYQVTFTNGSWSLSGPCQRTETGCVVKCPVSVRNLQFVVKQTSSLPFVLDPSNIEEYFNNLLYPKRRKDQKLPPLIPYNVSVNYEGTITIEVNTEMEENKPLTIVQVPLFGNRSSINEKSNYTQSKYSAPVCLNKIIETFEGLIYNKGWFWTQFDSLFREIVYKNQIISPNCLQNSLTDITTARCLDREVNGEYLRCVREANGWETLTWFTLFDWVCRRQISYINVKDCNIKLFGDTDDVYNDEFNRCVKEASLMKSSP